MKISLKDSKTREIMYNIEHINAVFKIKTARKFSNFITKALIH